MVVSNLGAAAKTASVYLRPGGHQTPERGGGDPGGWSSVIGWGVLSLLAEFDPFWANFITLAILAKKKAKFGHFWPLLPILANFLAVCRNLANVWQLEEN